MPDPLAGQLDQLVLPGAEGRENVGKHDEGAYQHRRAVPLFRLVDRRRDAALGDREPCCDVAGVGGKRLRSMSIAVFTLVSSADLRLSAPAPPIRSHQKFAFPCQAPLLSGELVIDDRKRLLGCLVQIQPARCDRCFFLVEQHAHVCRPLVDTDQRRAQLVTGRDRGVGVFRRPQPGNQMSESTVRALRAAAKGRGSVAGTGGPAPATIRQASSAIAGGELLGRAGIA